MTFYLFMHAKLTWLNVHHLEMLSVVIHLTLHNDMHYVLFDIIM